MLRVYIKPPGEDWVEYTPIVRADREFEIGGRAFNGEADQGTITIDDPDLTLDEVIEFGGHREVKITVDDSGSEKVLALGRIGPKSMERGAHPHGRELTLTIEDVNVELRGIIVDKWGRPEETGRQRVAALRLAYLHGSLSTHSRARDSTNIDIDDFFPDANTSTMPAKFYEGTDPLSVIRECAEWEGKLTFVYPQDNGDKELFYAVPNDLTLHNCTLEVSDDPDDVDDVTVFAPWWNAGPALNSDPLETITGLTLIHPDGERTYDNEPTAEDTFDKWEESMFTEVPPGALADSQMATILNARTHEEKRRQFSLRLPESKVHLIKQGMLLHVIKADAANIPNITGGSQKYRIAQIRYRWYGPDAADDNAFLVIVTLEVNTKLKLRWGRGAQAQKPPPTPTPAPPADPQPEDTITVIAHWQWNAAHGTLDDTDTYDSNITRHASSHSWTGPPAGSITADHGDCGNSGEIFDAVPVTAGTTVSVTIGKFRWKWGPHPLFVNFYSTTDGTGVAIETWTFEDGSGKSTNILYTNISGTHVAPVGTQSARIQFSPGLGLSVVDDVTIGTIDPADEVVNDPHAVNYGDDCPHESPHFLPSDWVICQFERQQEQINSATNSALSWFIVTTYGAEGDGTTDDTAAINLAIAALNTAGAGVLYFPAGKYLVSGALTTITANALILGDGPHAFEETIGGSIVVQSSATANLFTITAEHVRVDHIGLLGTHGTPTAGAAVSCQGTDVRSRVDFTDCHIFGFWIGADIQVGAGWVMDGCLFQAQRKYSVKIQNTSNDDIGDWAIANSYFTARTHAADAAIRIESSGGGKIINSKVNRYGVEYVRGIDLSVATAISTSVLIVNGNSFENISGDAFHAETAGAGTYGLILFNNNQVALYGNNSGKAVSLIAASAGNIADVVIGNNLFTTDGTARSAIQLTNVDNVTLVGNELSDNFTSLYTNTTSTNITEVGGDVAAHLADTSDAHDASAISITDAGTYFTGTDVEAALQELGADVAAGTGGGIGEILIADTHSTPLVFGDLLQNEAEDNLLYADV